MWAERVPLNHWAASRPHGAVGRITREDDELLIATRHKLSGAAAPVGWGRGGFVTGRRAVPINHERLHGPLYACDGEACGWTDREGKAVRTDNVLRCPRCHKPVRKVRDKSLLDGLNVTFTEAPRDTKRRKWRRR